MRATDGIGKLARRCNPISLDCQMRPITKPSANAAKIAKPITIGAVIGYAREARLLACRAREGKLLIY